MTIEQKMQAIEENYLNGNWQDAVKLFKELTVPQRKSYAIDAMYLTYNADTCKNEKYEFGAFLIRNI